MRWVAWSGVPNAKYSLDPLIGLRVLLGKFSLRPLDAGCHDNPPVVSL